MLYWLVPYLVAYNGSASGDWKYGPEHIFKAEANIFVTLPMEKSQLYSHVMINFGCRPMKSSLIQCQVDSSTLDRYKTTTNSSFDSNSMRSKHEETSNTGNVVFQVEFNEWGISKVWFLNTNRGYIINMILAVIGTINTGIKIADNNFNYVSNHVLPEKSIIGVCETSFDIKKTVFTNEEMRNETKIDGFQFLIPDFAAPKHDETIVVDKSRNLNDCTKKTPYFFGSSEDSIYETNSGRRKQEMQITYSESRMLLREKSFSAYTKNRGTLIFDIEETIRVSLESIRPATDSVRNTGNLKNVGAGFEPGISWPERRNRPEIKYFM